MRRDPHSRPGDALEDEVPLSQTQLVPQTLTQPVKKNPPPLGFKPLVVEDVSQEESIASTLVNTPEHREHDREAAVVVCLEVRRRASHLQARVLVRARRLVAAVRRRRPPARISQWTTSRQRRSLAS